MTKVTTEFNTPSLGFSGHDGVYPESFGDDVVTITTFTDATESHKTTHMKIPEGIATMDTLKYWIEVFEKHQKMISVLVEENKTP